MRSTVPTPQLFYPTSRLPGLLLRTLMAVLLFAGGYWLGSGMGLADLQNGDLRTGAARAEALHAEISALLKERDGLKARVTELEKVGAPSPAETKN